METHKNKCLVSETGINLKCTPNTKVPGHYIKLQGTCAKNRTCFDTLIKHSKSF